MDYKADMRVMKLSELPRPLYKRSADKDVARAVPVIHARLLQDYGN